MWLGRAVVLLLVSNGMHHRMFPTNGWMCLWFIGAGFPLSQKKTLKRKEWVFHIAFIPFSVKIKHIEVLPITNALLQKF